MHRGHELNRGEHGGCKASAAHNCRFVPAVQLARRLITEGRLGRIYHFRARFCDESMIDPDTPHG